MDLIKSNRGVEERNDPASKAMQRLLYVILLYYFGILQYYDYDVPVPIAREQALSHPRLVPRQDDPQ
eukprot:jgi/Psemu1/307145/fgenesh1_kg.305_\